MKWYRSLYWRIAFGFVAFLAAMLVSQAMLLVWSVSRSGRTLPDNAPGRFARTVALDVAGALERDPAIDVSKYVREQYAQITHPFFILMADGRVITSGSDAVPDGLLRLARQRLERPFDPRFERPDRFPAEGNPGFRERPEPPGDGPFRFVRPIPIVVHSQLAGVVVVPERAPFGFLLGRFAPTLTVVLVTVLLGGTVLAIVVFRPARRRLGALEDAARRFGGGDLGARAPEAGGDEIAAVAHAFNAMADDLARRAQALAESDRVRRQLLADVSHELTTPVTAMRGYLETLAMPELRLDDATRARYLGIVSDETARLERIIGDLLDLARLEGGGGELRLAPVPVASLFERVAARHERACETSGVRLEYVVGAGAETVRADADRLEQALQNLAANAMRYAPEGTAITLRSSATGDDEIALTVEDAGAGIEPAHLARVFDRFYKAESARAGNTAGSGLGLSIVKAIVERHGGRVSVDSQPGRTVFTLILRRS